MILEMKVPSPGESITEVEIATWLVSDGDYVEKDQVIAEVDSDKATLELPAEESGLITLKADEGDAVEVGQVVCLIDTSAVNDSKPKTVIENTSKEVKKETSIPQSNTKSHIASPSARKIITENNLEISDITGTGKDGRVTKEDAVNSKPSMGSPSNNNDRSESRTKLSMLRRKVAERLVTVKNETAMLTTFNEVDMSAIFDLRSKYKEEFKSKHAVGLGFMSFFTLAVVRALKLFPAVNSMIDGKEMITYDYCDISIAVSGPKGLMVPVIRHAEKMSFKEVESEVKRLAIRARDSKITVDEMT